MTLRYQVKNRETGKVVGEVEAKNYTQAASIASTQGFDRKHYYVSLI